MSAESNPNIYTPYSKSTAIWCSFWAFWTRLPTWFQFCSSHVGQSCLVLLGNLFIYPPAVLADLWQLPWGSWVHPGSPLWTWTLPAKMTLFQTLDFACVGCAKQSLVIPQNRGWVLSQWFRHTDRSLFCHASAAFQHNNMLRGNVGAWHWQIWSALYVTKETFVIWFFIGAFCQIVFVF